MNRVLEAEAVVNLYVGILKTADIVVTLGPSHAPGTTGFTSAPGGVFVFYSPRPGVITYQYCRGRLVPIPIPDEEYGKNTGWDWELEVFRGLELGRAFVITAAATTLTVVMALVLAPVSS